MAANVSFWKIFSFLSFISSWSAESLKPDEDNIVRLDVNEIAKLAEGICSVFGWKAEIALPKDTTMDIEGIIE